MGRISTTDANVLVVDDEPLNLSLVEAVLSRQGYSHIQAVSSPYEALAICDGTLPDLIVLDLQMPEMDGFQLMSKLNDRLPEEDYLPILVLTSDFSQESRRRALSMGAKDFVTKPLDTTEVVLRIRNLLETRFLYCQLQRQNQDLEVRVRERTAELEAAQTEILTRLALAAEYRDDATGEHTRRVGQIAAMIARRLGCSEQEAALIRRAAPLHDLGKIAVPDGILLKAGRLTDEEITVMRTHTEIGGKILANSQAPLLQLAEIGARTHHERWDGSGYSGVAGQQIPLIGRIIAVADVFDALTHERPYKRAWPRDEAIAEIRDKSGSHFDPSVVAAFLDIVIAVESA